MLRCTRTLDACQTKKIVTYGETNILTYHIKKKPIVQAEMIVMNNASSCFGISHF